MNFQTIGVRELWDMIRKPDIFVIDLREPEEYCRFHIDGACNYPYHHINQWKDSLPLGKRIILYCEYGGTSMLAAKRLSRLGYDVYTLVGGISALNN